MEDIVAKLEITLARNGEVKVNGPIQDRVLSYGMLGVARDLIHEYSQRNAKPQSNLIAPVIPIPPRVGG